MQVYTATDESDVGMIRPGQKVTFRVDAFPKDKFGGVVGQVRMNATTVQNVVTYNTIIDFANPDLKLFPGMTAYITIPVATAPNVLRVPNGALRFKPDLPQDQLRALYDKAGIRMGGGGGQQQQAQAGQAGADQAAGAGAGANRQMNRNGERPGGGAGPNGAASTAHAANGSGGGGPMDRAIVWKLGADKQLEPVQIKTGITDHTFTEVAQALHGSLNPGDELVVGAASASKPTGGSGGGAPGMGGAPRMGGR
jgi:HlyD family secretion protein